MLAGAPATCKNCGAPTSHCWKCGCFIALNDEHLSQGGVFSEKRWAALQPELRAEHERILDAKGFTREDADPVFAKMVDGFLQASVMMDSYFTFLASTGGPVSVKGRTRRAVEGWSRAADRVAKFARLLGLERRSRSVPMSTRQWLESEP